MKSKRLEILEVKKEIGLIIAQDNPFLDALLKASGLLENLKIAEKIYLDEK